MEDIKQVIVFEKQGVDGILTAMDDLADKYKVAEKAKEGVFSGLEKDAKAAKGALADTAKESANASGTMGRLKTVAAGTGAEMRKAAGGVKIFGVSFGDVKAKIESAKASLGSFGRSGGEAGKAAAKGFNAARIGSLALNASLGLIGVAFALIAVAIKRSQPLMDKFGVITAQVGAVIDVALDRVTAFVEGIQAIFGGDVQGGLAKAKGAFEGIGDELQREVEITRRLVEEQQKLERIFFNLDIRRAAANKQLKELNLIIDDQSRTAQERSDASIKFANIEQGLIAEEIEAQERLIANTLNLEAGTEEFRRKLAELGTAGLVFDELGDKTNQFSLSLGDIGIANTTLEGAKELSDQYVKLQQIQSKSFQTQTRNNNKLVQIERERQAEIDKAYQERKKLEKELFDFQKQIQGQLEQLAIDESEGAERIELERKVAQAQIDELERVAKEKFEAAGKAFNLEAEFIELRAGIERNAAKRTSEFKLAEAKKEIETRRDIDLAYTELLSASADAELSLEEFKARERVRIQKEALAEQRKAAVAEFGEGAAQVLAIDIEVNGLEAEDVQTIQDAAQRVRDEALKGIDNRKAIRLAENELLTEAANDELTLEQTKQREKNRILIDALLERRKIISEQLGANAPEVKLLDLEIEGLQREINKIDNVSLDPLTKIKTKIQQAFNLDDETSAQLVQQSKVAFNAVVQGLEAIYQRQLAENDRLLEQIDGRIERIQEGLDEELALKERGVANSAQVLQDQLNTENARRERAEEKRLEIERKAAKQRLIIDAAQQVSSLALAAVQLLASEASKGLVGLILAGAGIATIFSIAAKAKAQAQQFSTEIPEFRLGGPVLDGLIVGPSHEEGGVLAAFAGNGKQKVVSLEGGEFITPVKQSKQYAGLLEAMRTDRLAKLDDETVLKMIGRNPTAGISQRPQVQHVFDSKGMSSKDVDRIVNAISSQLQPVLLPDGKTIKWVEATGVQRPFNRILP